jgi:hypothetical protein
VAHRYRELGFAELGSTLLLAELLSVEWKKLLLRTWVGIRSLREIYHQLTSCAASRCPTQRSVGWSSLNSDPWHTPCPGNNHPYERPYLISSILLFLRNRMLRPTVIPCRHIITQGEMVCPAAQDMLPSSSGFRTSVGLWRIPSTVISAE